MPHSYRVRGGKILESIAATTHGGGSLSPESQRSAVRRLVFAILAISTDGLSSCQTSFATSPKMGLTTILSVAAEFCRSISRAFATPNGMLASAKDERMTQPHTQNKLELRQSQPHWRRKTDRARGVAYARSVRLNLNLIVGIYGGLLPQKPSLVAQNEG
jgi:hypothetical protein